jgi:hypothetical protein
MGVANGTFPQSVALHHFQSWSSVSRLFVFLRLCALANSVFSICVISIVRCIAIANLNLTDVTYDVVLDNICTALEPTLGCINACLPLLQPVASSIAGSSALSWLKSLTSNMTSRRRLRSNESGGSKPWHGHSEKTDSTGGYSHRHPHQGASDMSRLYPLTDVTITRTSEITLNGSHSDLSKQSFGSSRV